MMSRKLVRALVPPPFADDSWVADGTGRVYFEASGSLRGGFDLRYEITGQAYRDLNDSMSMVPPMPTLRAN